MAAGHLDALRVGDELGLPAHDPVALGVDARHVHPVLRERRPEPGGERAVAVVGEALLAAGAARFPRHSPRALDGGERQRAAVEHRLQVGTQGHGVRHEVGPAGRDRPREVPAAAVADDRDSPLRGRVECVDAPLDSLERALRAVRVGDEAADGGAVADPPQPPRQGRERVVAAEEARDEHHGAAVPRRDPAAAVPHRVDGEAGRLEHPARLAEVVAPPAAGRNGLGHAAMTYVPGAFAIALWARLPSFFGAGTSSPDRVWSQAM